IKTMNEIFPLVIMEKEKLAECEYFSFDDLKPGIIKSKVFPLSQILKESFNLETEALKLDRLDRNFFNILDLNGNLLCQLLYKENESELEIVSVINKEDRITLKGNSNREIITPHIEGIHDVIISEYELHLDEMIFNISMDDIDSSDLLLLKSDSRFSHKLTETKSKFLKKYELFTE
ncbi:MAG TPA: hypothetical protein VFV86_12550, partial [Nitrososphaeraceae archaeon]|nr:hypothetical protein [Nitrososphaeraceae archaeon]